MTDSTPDRSPSFSSGVKHLQGLYRGYCPACGDSSARLIDYAWVRYCQECLTYAATDRTTRVAYDAAYVAERYDRYATTHLMSERRLDILEHVLHLHETLPLGLALRRGRLLDVGYGNGSLIRRALWRGWDAFGHDVNPTEYEGVRRVPLPTEPLPEGERYRVITFYDALEHFEDLFPARQVVPNADWLVITVPRAPYYLIEGEWKHKRPGEHHFYWWNPRSFETIFAHEAVEVSLVYVDSPEDVIRGKLPDGLDNTLTAVLRCRRLDL